MKFQRRAWHVDMIGGLILVVIVTAAWCWDKGRQATAAVPELTLRPAPSGYSICKDGQPAEDWQCPDGERL